MKIFYRFHYPPCRWYHAMALSAGQTLDGFIGLVTLGHVGSSFHSSLVFYFSIRYFKKARSKETAGR